MPEPYAVALVPASQLAVSRAPTAELAAAAILATSDAGLERPDLIILAVTGGTGAAVRNELDVAGAVEAARRAAPARA